METDYTQGVPIKPPEDIIEWLHSKKELTAEALLYRAAYITDPLTGERRKMVEVRCTACGQVMYEDYVPACGCHPEYASAPFGWYNPETTEDVISHSETICPECGCEATALHIGAFRNRYELESAYPLTVHRIDDRIALLSWYIRKDINKYGDIDYTVLPYEGYIFDGKACIKLAGYIRCMCSLSFYGKWVQRTRCIDTYGMANLIYPWNADMLIGTSLENCKLDLYAASGSCYPITFLRIYNRHKNVENIVTSGASELLTDIISANANRSGGYCNQANIPVIALPEINWKAKRPSQMLGLTRTELRAAVDGRWTLNHLNFFIEHKSMLRLEDMADIKALGTMYSLEGFFDGNEPDPAIRLPGMRAVRYCMKQQADPKTLYDYWHMAQQLGENLADEHVRYPHRLKSAHDRYVERICTKKNKALCAGFTAQYKRLIKYSYTSGGLMIRPCKTQSELNREGSDLHHCVATYAQAYAEGRSAIFFVRHTDKPNKSYFTLELDVKTLKVIQNRGAYNCSRSAEVKAFETEWLMHIKDIEKKEKKYGRTAEEGRDPRAVA